MIHIVYDSDCYINRLFMNLFIIKFGINHSHNTDIPTK
jgi:hypothetical protein